MPGVNCTELLKKERWRKIKSCPGYEVSDFGRVRSFWTKGRYSVIGTKATVRALKPTRDGHLQVSFKRKRYAYVHRLVLEAFIGPCPPGMECCHADDNPSNNKLSNLSWGTRHMNMEDRERNGRILRGDSAPWSKLTEKDVTLIRHRAAKGEKVSVILRDYQNVTDGAIRRVVCGATFKHVRSVVDEGTVLPVTR